MAYEIGDWRIATLTVTPADGTTLAVLAVVAPDGTTTAPVITGAGGSWAAAGYELTAAGEWVERWTVTGMGKSKERAVLLVAPDPTALPTGTRVYATTTDYANALRAAPPSGSRLALAKASAAVDDMLLTAVYDVDAVTGLPTDAAVIVALRDATCAQAEDLRAAKAAAAGSFSIGSISVTRSAPQTVREEEYRSPRAFGILQRAGLTGQSPWGY
ncbi:MAG TPA: hypothetical protein VFQ15_03565 [Jiangellaceae bacterium]|nr:hypothetical protein [Jiangellaceae bacterium]